MAPSKPMLDNYEVYGTYIELIWNQNMTDIVHNYTISYSASFRGCSGVPHNFNKKVIEGDITEVNITDLEENSEVTIKITAINSVGNSSTSLNYTTLSTSKLLFFPIS